MKFLRFQNIDLQALVNALSRVCATIMSTKPTQPLSRDTAVSVAESPPRGSLHCAVSFDCPPALGQMLNQVCGLDAAKLL